MHTMSGLYTYVEVMLTVSFSCPAKDKVISVAKIKFNILSGNG